MIRRVASTPSITGMSRSISTTSGVSAAHWVTASAPLLATQTIWCCGSKASARRSAASVL